MSAGNRQLQSLGQINNLLYGNQASSAVDGRFLSEQNVVAVEKYNNGLREAYQQLTPESNKPFYIAGAYALDG
eukprot:13051407-Heterocapsa_arctica.AAC.1